MAFGEPSDARWLAFGGALETWTARGPHEVRPLVRAVEAAVEARGLFAAGFLAYDAAPAFDPALRVRTTPAGGRDDPDDRPPLAWFGLFEAPKEVAAPPLSHGAFRLGPWRAALDEAAHRDAVARIRAHIARGDTYQVNLTFPLTASFEGDPAGAFLHLAEVQPTPYAAFLDLGRWVICSASPELFFERDGTHLLSRPMKGTAPRGRTLAEDDAQRDRLQSSAKDRAENVMIVDMVRNDMGRIAALGSVEVPALFEVEHHPTLLQMTSTVRARTHATHDEVLAALFPFASITGAPKVRTMGIIADLEPSPRGIYTGAIGYMAPGRRARFSVAIRTLVVDTVRGAASYGVGSGIVWDSSAEAEHAECLLKARVLDAPPAGFELLETLRWTPGDGFARLDRHLARLAASARYFGFRVDDGRVRAELARAVSACPAETHRVRLLAGRRGEVRVEAHVLGPFPDTEHLALAPAPVDPGDVFLFHKTTRRDAYDAALRACPGAGDVLLWNTRGEITETCRANVAVRLDGSLVTPPVACGLLSGTLRNELIDEGALRERIVSREDLARAEAVFVLSSLRGLRRARFAPGGPHTASRTSRAGMPDQG